MNGFNLSALAVRERAVTLFLIIAIMLAGAYAFFQLGRAEDPPFTVKTLTVSAVWPGATAQEMQDLVAEPLEKRMQELRWYDRVETFTRPGLMLMSVTLKDTTPPSQVPEQFYQARKKLGDEAAQAAGRGARPVRQRRVLGRHLRPLCREGQRHAAAGADPRSRGAAPASAARAGRQEGQHPRRTSRADLRRVLLYQARYAGLSAHGHLRRACSARTSSRRQARSTPTGPQVFIRVDGAYDNLQTIADTPIDSRWPRRSSCPTSPR